MITLTREEVQQVLDVLEESCFPRMSVKHSEAYDKAIETLRASLAEPEPEQPDAAGLFHNPIHELNGKARAAKTVRAQPEQEPVAWGVLNTRPTEKQTLMMVMTYKSPPSDLVVPLYLAPPQREWVWLTADEIWNEWCEQSKPERDTRNFVAAYARAIEAKLKEKNA